MMDSGRIITWSDIWSHHLLALYDLHDRLRIAFNAGVTVCKGKVVDKPEVFKKLVAHHYHIDRKSTDRWAVPLGNWTLCKGYIQHPSPP
ncbi:MAG: hypothetical protein IPI95_03675 [Flavobacteriales bacterium]|nr:hypothetical protein [Flavobacteriales bacterium]